MIFQKTSQSLEGGEMVEEEEMETGASDDIETVVGPSVHVEGDLSSAGNIIVKGTVSGNVFTSKHLTVEKGAKIIANVRSGSATVAGEIKGNIKVKETLELTPTSRLIGDVTVNTLSVEAGAVIYGKVIMPGVEPDERKKTRSAKTLKKGGAEQGK